MQPNNFAEYAPFYAAGNTKATMNWTFSFAPSIPPLKAGYLAIAISFSM
jgi:hypothetical protein